MTFRIWLGLGLHRNPYWGLFPDALVWRAGFCGPGVDTLVKDRVDLRTSSRAAWGSAISECRRLQFRNAALRRTMRAYSRQSRCLPSGLFT